MSLDVYLFGPVYVVVCRCQECGNKHTTEDRENLYSDNITHNLTAMADAAGLYKPVWHPETLGIRIANQLIPILRDGLETLRSNPGKFAAFNPANGWGSYPCLLQFVKDYLDACEMHPDATIEVSR